MNPNEMVEKYKFIKDSNPSLLHATKITEKSVKFSYNIKIMFSWYSFDDLRKDIQKKVEKFIPSLNHQFLM